MRLSLQLQRIALLVILLILVVGCGARPQTEFDQASLERREDLSESLANDLLKLSIAVRDRDYATVERFFSDAVRATP